LTVLIVVQNGNGIKIVFFLVKKEKTSIVITTCQECLSQTYEERKIHKNANMACMLPKHFKVNQIQIGAFFCDRYKLEMRKYKSPKSPQSALLTCSYTGKTN